MKLASQAPQKEPLQCFTRQSKRINNESSAEEGFSFSGRPFVNLEGQRQASAFRATAQVCERARYRMDIAAPLVRSREKINRETLVYIHPRRTLFSSRFSRSRQPKQASVRGQKISGLPSDFLKIPGCSVTAKSCKGSVAASGENIFGILEGKKKFCIREIQKRRQYFMSSGR